MEYKGYVAEIEYDDSVDCFTAGLSMPAPIR